METIPITEDKAVLIPQHRAITMTSLLVFKNNTLNRGNPEKKKTNRWLWEKILRTARLWSSYYFIMGELTLIKMIWRTESKLLYQTPNPKSAQTWRMVVLQLGVGYGQGSGLIWKDPQYWRFEIIGLLAIAPWKNIALGRRLTDKRFGRGNFKVTGCGGAGPFPTEIWRALSGY